MSTKMDVLVIGGGVIGASCAYYLSRHGRRVVLIEREDVVCPVGCSSYANAGLVMPSDIYPLPSPGVLGQGMKWLLDSSSPLYIKPRLSPSLARWLVGFAAASRTDRMRRGMPVLRSLGREGLRAFDEIGESGALDAGYHHNGILSLYLSGGAFESAAATSADLQQSFGVLSEVLDSAAVHDRVPAALPSVVGGVLTSEDGFVEPSKLTRGLIRMAEGQGATVLTATEAIGFERAGRTVTEVTTTAGGLRADTVVLAAGVWSGALGRQLGLSLPVEPAKGYSVMVERPEGVPDDLALYLPEGHACVTPFGESVRFAGTLELSGMNDRVLPNRVAAIRRGVGRYFRQVESSPTQQLWRGLRPMTPDGLPMIGRPAGYDNLVVATGHNMNGIMYGPVTGKLVAEIVDGAPASVDLDALKPERFGLI